MRKANPILLAVTSLALVGCNESTAPPRDVVPPVAPQGLYSVTGDAQVTLYWTPNTEGDLAGYRVYEAPCSDGPNCPYDRVGSTATTQFAVTGLSNGVTRYFAVAVTWPGTPASSTNSITTVMAVGELNPNDRQYT